MQTCALQGPALSVYNLNLSSAVAFQSEVCKNVELEQQTFVWFSVREGFTVKFLEMWAIVCHFEEEADARVILSQQ